MEAEAIEELQMLTALHVNEVPAEETGVRIGRPMEIHILGGKITLEETHFLSDWRMVLVLGS